MRLRSGWMLLGMVAIGTPSHADDCALGQRDLALAHDRMANYATEEAVGFLKQSVEVCPSYEAYEQLAELAAQSSEQDDKRKAVDAFVAADARAPSPQAAAKTLFEYAKFLNADGDPQNANVIIKQARALDPTNADILAEYDLIEKQVDHPTQATLVRTLSYSSPYKPPTGGGFAYRMSSSHASEGTSANVTAPTAGPSINISINFDTGSVAIDVQTRPNLTVLAKALADPSMQGREFTFIGHTDRRGGDQYNLGLSLQRAEAMREIVDAMEPSLKGRIRVEGHGAREPIDLGNDERALRANRRLQVTVDKQS